MPLLLKPVPPAQGTRWVRDAFRLYARAPLAFSLMFAAFLFAVLISAFLPYVGGVLMLAALPLLSLGFMVASESALANGPVHPGYFIQPLRRDAGRRRSLLVLCGLYAVGSITIIVVSDAIDNGAFERLRELLAKGNATPEIDELVSQPSFWLGLLVRFGLATLLSVPFWHAPALVHWGAQGPAQSLFSSTLAVWRSKGAFVVYSLTWLGLIIAFGALAALLFGLLGMGQFAGIVALPAGLMFSTVFYVSLLFTFNDSFGGAAVPGVPGTGGPPLDN